MPKFILNKLVRDKLRDEYERMGQKASYRALSPDEHMAELKRKIIEEAKEIPEGATADQTISEIADIQQAINDLKDIKNITDEQVETARAVKFDKKGGFSGATFVESLELQVGDEWIEYYRREPSTYIEVDDGRDNELRMPALDPGVYEHYKGEKYEVIGVSLDTETLQPMVVYKPLYGTKISLWARPYDMFISTVDIAGETVPRFKKVE